MTRDGNCRLKIGFRKLPCIPYLLVVEHETEKAEIQKSKFLVHGGMIVIK